MQYDISDFNHKASLDDLKVGDEITREGVNYLVAAINSTWLVVGILLMPNLMSSEYYHLIMHKRGGEAQFEKLDLA